VTTKNRMKAYRDSQINSGKKRVDMFVTEEHHEILKSIRQETKESYGDIIGRFLLTGQPQSKAGMKSVTIELPEKLYDRLDADYDIEEYLSETAIRKAESLFSVDDGDF
jgi:hypothetical protein